MAKSKLKKFQSLSQMKHVIQPNRDDLMYNKLNLKGQWRSKFQNTNPIVVELGCGKGEYTTELARKNPDVNYIGVDIKGARIYTGAKLAQDQSYKNVMFLRIQIEYLNYAFSNGEIDEVWITFPDPQIKYNRRNKRLTSPSMLEMYRKLVTQKGVVHLKTDSLFLHGYTLGLLETGKYKVHKTMHDLYNTYHNDNMLNIKTHYENIFLKNNNPITYLSFSFI